MGTLNAIYVRASDQSTTEAVRVAYPSAFTEPGTDFFAIEQPTNCFQCPEPELQDFSSRLKTDVVWLSFQSVVDAFQYHHWRDGIHLRSLVYGCFDREREWQRVEGQPQEWEAAVLFEGIERSLARNEPFAPSKEEKQRLQQILNERVISTENIEPGIDAREAARGVARFYHLPGWSLEAS